MNLLNVPEKEVSKKRLEYSMNIADDKLGIFFRIGRDYMKKYQTKRVNIHSKEDQEQIRHVIFSLTEELYEFANTLKNKKWCVEEYPVDEEHAMEELCDIWAFMIQLFLMLGFDENKLLELYLKKMVVNEFRLRSNY